MLTASFAVDLIACARNMIVVVEEGRASCFRVYSTSSSDVTHVVTPPDPRALRVSRLARKSQTATSIVSFESTPPH